MAQLRFNADDHQQDSDAPRHDGGKRTREPLPDGEYTVVIIESDYCENSKRNGHYVKLKLEVQEDGGRYRGRWLWDYLNVDNPSDEAQRIANERLAVIAHAVGAPQFDDTEQLHYRDLIAVVETEMYRGKPQNKVVGYLPANRTSVARRERPAQQPRQQPSQQRTGDVSKIERRAKPSTYNKVAWDNEHGDGSAQAKPQPDTPQSNKASEYGLDDDIPF